MLQSCSAKRCEVDDSIFGKKYSNIVDFKNALEKFRTDNPDFFNFLPNVIRQSDLITTIEYLRYSGCHVGEKGFSDIHKVCATEATYIIKNYSWINRSIDRIAVETYRARINKGEYIFNNQGFYIGRLVQEENKPVIMDGNHRLFAISKVDKNIEISIFFANPNTTVKNIKILKTLDTGKVRTLNNSFQFDNVKKNRASIINIITPIIKFEKNITLFLGDPVTRKHTYEYIITSSDYFEFYYKWKKEINECLKLRPKFKKALFDGAHIFLTFYLYYRFMERDDSMVDFINKLITGTGLEANSLELIFREYVRTYANQGGLKRSRINLLEKNTACAMAFYYKHNKLDFPYSKFNKKMMENFLINEFCSNDKSKADAIKKMFNPNQNK